jgi:UDP-glucuronate 4-epimerase
VHVVVTGAAGFIGSHLCGALAARGHRVTATDGYDGFLYPAEVKRRNAAAMSVPIVEADLGDAGAMTALVQGADVVCHLAAIAGVSPSLLDPARYVQTNLVGTTVLLEAIRASACRRLVFASSSSVYGAVHADDLSKVQAFREDDLCLTPASPYAATKRAGELICSTYRDLFGIGITSLRFFTVYGPRQRPDMAIHKFTAAIAAGRPITVFGDGESRRDYTFVDDIVAGVVASIERVQPASWNIYNLGNTQTVSLSEMIATIEEVVGKQAIVERQPDRPGDVPITFADVSRAARDLDYRPTVALPDGVRAFWKWYQEQ